MVDLIDYVKLNKEKSCDDIDENLFQHLIIEYYQDNLYSRKRIILEKYGIYDGCEELARYLYNYFLDLLHDKKLEDKEYIFTKEKELKDFSNIFFNKLIINIDTSEDRGAEYIDNEKLNKDLVFDEVVIDINSEPRNFMNLLMHELTHAYNNYMMLLKGNRGYIDTANSLLYKNIMNTDTFTEDDDLILRCLYFILGYERNAFFAEIKADLETHKERINGPKDALNILKQNIIYRTYKYLGQCINDYYNEKLSPERQRYIEKFYYRITNKTKTSYQIFKDLKYRFDKSLKKLDNVLPKLCIENLNNILITDDSLRNRFLISC